MRLRKPRRLRLAVAAGLILAATAAGGAFAAFPDTNVDTYTGCLNVGGTSGGTISQVTLGLSPLKTCSSNQQLIHLSGGDITKVTAGAGLTGGGANGAVTLSLAGGYQLPQSCAAGKIPQWDGSAWQCADDQTYTNGTGLDLSGNTFSVNSDYQLPQSCSSGQDAQWDGTKWTCANTTTAGVYREDYLGWTDSGTHDFGYTSISAGSYLVIARLNLHANDDATLGCRLMSQNHGDVDFTQTALEGDSTIGTNANWQTTVLMAQVSSQNPDTLSVQCDSPGGDQDAEVRISAVRTS